MMADSCPGPWPCRASSRAGSKGRTPRPPGAERAPRAASACELQTGRAICSSSASARASRRLTSRQGRRLSTTVALRPIRRTRARRSDPWRGRSLPPRTRSCHPQEATSTASRRCRTSRAYSGCFVRNAAPAWLPTLFVRPRRVVNKLHPMTTACTKSERFFWTRPVRTGYVTNARLGAKRIRRRTARILHAFRDSKVRGVLMKPSRFRSGEHVTRLWLEVKP